MGGREDELPFFVVYRNGKEEVVRRSISSPDEALSGESIGIGSSMLPVLQPGDRVELEPLRDIPPVGSIITFLTNGRLITHRVTRTSGDRFWARGDNGIYVQGPLSLGQTAGRVVAFWRDGKRHDLSSDVDRYIGLFRNHSLATLRKLALHYPNFRRFVEIDVLSSLPARMLLQQVTRKLFGDVAVVEETDKLKIMAGIMTGEYTWREDNATWIEEKLKNNQMRAFYARFSHRAVMAGSVVLVEDDLVKLGKIGYVGWLAVQLGFRGAGVGRKLLEALERGARGSSREFLIAEVMPDNTRSLGLFHSMGYRDATGGEIEKWPRELSGRLLEGRVVVVKNLQ